jgi:MFS family permease
VDFDSETFRQSRPILLTTFTNKVGSIGLSLVPILLVKKGVSTAEGALVLSTLKLVILAGTLAGGALSDRWSSRTLVLAALLMSAFGLGLLPFQSTLLLILLCGVVAQSAESVMNVTQRLLLVDNVEPGRHREALGWLRMVSNFAQIFSFSIAAAAGRFGVAPLMVFDASTSLGAWFVGRKILPAAELKSGSQHTFSEQRTGPMSSKFAFFGTAVVLMGWAFMYELFLEGGSGRLEALHPGQGLTRFSTMMVLNTVLCAAFAVQAARFLHKALPAIAGGLALTAAGIVLAVWGMAAQSWVLLGMLLVTVGEIMLGALAQYTLMRQTPSGANAGFYYSTGLTLMQCGRIAGAGLAFPLLIHASSLGPFMSLMGGASVLLLLVLLALRKSID